MKTFKSRSRFLGGLLAGALCCGSALAADYPARRTLETQSRAAGLGRARVALLTRAPGRGVSAVSADLLARFAGRATGITTAGDRQVLRDKERLRTVGAGWYLQLEADGTAGRYRNHAAMESAPAKPLNERLSLDRLETLGRQFIASELKGIVELAPNEQLVPFKTEYQVDGALPATGGALEEEVALNTVVFSRSVDGVHVVGAGSKVAVHFTQDGRAVGFDFDWPRYAPTGRFQAVEPVKSILGRGEKLAERPFSEAKEELLRFECGLFDAGVRRRGAGAVIQAGCFMHRLVTSVGSPERNKLDPNDGLDKAAFADPIPAGTVVEPDTRWPQALALCTRAPECGRMQDDGEDPGQGVK